MNTEFTTKPSEHEKRLDWILAQRFPQTSRAEWKRIIEQGCVRINKNTCHKSTSVASGDFISVDCENLTKSNEVLPNPLLKVCIVFQDEHILAINKPANMPTHPLNFVETNTALNAIIAIEPSIATAGENPREGGLVHRLDNQTSGLLVAAKHPQAFSALRDSFSVGTSTKSYIALVHGTLRNSCTINFPIAHHSSISKKMVAVKTATNASLQTGYRGTPRDATTQVEIIERLPEHTLLKVTISHGQRHQIRLHLSAIGHPICADEVYTPQALRERECSGMKRHALHAHEAKFIHPILGHEMLLEAPLPDDMAAAVTRLKRG